MKAEPMDDKNWQAESDAHTLIEAETIKLDKKRMEKALKAAKDIAKEKESEAKAAKKIVKNKTQEMVLEDDENSEEETEEKSK